MLPEIRSLKLHEISDVSLPHLTEKFPNLESLTLKMPKFGSVPNYFDFTEDECVDFFKSMEKLVQLTFHTDKWSGEKLRKVERYLQYMPNLQKLDINFSLPTTIRKNTVVEFLKVKKWRKIETQAKYFPKLKEFTMTNSGTDKFESIVNSLDNFPDLESLKLHFGFIHPRIDPIHVEKMLQKIPNIRYLDVYIKSRFKSEYLEYCPKLKICRLHSSIWREYEAAEKYLIGNLYNEVTWNKLIHKYKNKYIKERVKLFLTSNLPQKSDDPDELDILSEIPVELQNEMLSYIGVILPEDKIVM